MEGAFFDFCSGESKHISMKEEPSKTTIEGKICVSVISGKEFELDVSSAFVGKGGDMIVSVDYFDYSAKNIEIRYLTNDGYRTQCIVPVVQNGWRTVKVVLKGFVADKEKAEISICSESTDYISRVGIFNPSVVDETVNTGDSIEVEKAYVRFDKNNEENKMKFIYFDSPTSDAYNLPASLYYGKTTRFIANQTKYIYFDVASDFITTEDNEVMIEVEYLDKGTDQIVLQYRSLSSAYSNVFITKTNTLTYKTAKFVLKDALFDSAQNYGGDFRLSAFEANGQPEYISAVYVTNYRTLRESGAKIANRTEIAQRLRLINVIDDRLQESAHTYLTREDAVKTVVFALGGKKEAEEKNGVSPFKDVDTAMEPYFAYASEHEIIESKDEYINSVGFVTVGELAGMLLRGLGFQTEGQDVAAMALEHGLIEYEMPQKYFETTAIVDELFGFVDAAMRQVPADEEMPLYTKAVSSGLITEEERKMIKDADLNYWLSGGNHMRLQSKEVIDPISKRPYSVIGSQNMSSAGFYFTGGNSFSADDKSIFLNHDYRQDGTTLVKFVRYYLETGETEVIDEGVKFYEGIAGPSNKFFYTKGTKAYLYDCDTKETKYLCTHPEGINFYGPPSITNDGKFATVYWRDADGRAREAAVINTETGEFKKFLESDTIKGMFAAPQDHFDHPIINPVDSNFIFFNRGNDTYIPDRMYTIDLRTNEIKNAYKQKMLANGTVGEAIGHEAWSNDGEWLYFVKYPLGISKLGPTGIMRVSKDGSKYEYVNTDHTVLHQSPSPDGKWVVADYNTIPQPDGKYKSKIVICNVETKESYILCDIYIGNGHPFHAHPAFSNDGTKILFTMLDPDDDFKGKVGVIDVSDIVRK